MRISFFAMLLLVSFSLNELPSLKFCDRRGIELREARIAITFLMMGLLGLESTTFAGATTY